MHCDRPTPKSKGISGMGYPEIDSPEYEEMVEARVAEMHRADKMPYWKFAFFMIGLLLIIVLWIIATSGVNITLNEEQVATAEAALVSAELHAMSILEDEKESLEERLQTARDERNALMKKLNDMTLAIDGLKESQENVRNSYREKRPVVPVPGSKDTAKTVSHETPQPAPPRPTLIRKHPYPPEAETITMIYTGHAFSDATGMPVWSKRYYGRFVGGTEREITSLKIAGFSRAVPLTSTVAVAWNDAYLDKADFRTALVELYNDGNAGKATQDVKAWLGVNQFYSQRIGGTMPTPALPSNKDVPTFHDAEQDLIDRLKAPDSRTGGRQ